jgi:hypothetical protein
MQEELIAPCGMNCGICSSYLARHYDIKSRGIRMPYCAGCRPRDKQCAFLKKKCSLLLNGEVKYCFECRDYPCERLVKLDARYKVRYHMSMIENLNRLKEKGLEELLESETKKWSCPKCGGVISCHNGLCFNCGLDILRNKKAPYTWEEANPKDQ